MENLKIRRAVSMDARNMCKIINEMESYHFYGALPFTSEQEIREMVDSAQTRGMVLLVAETQGTLAGFAALQQNDCIQRRRTMTFSLIVSARYRRQGCGRELLKAVRDMAFNWYGAHRLELEVMADNLNALALYRSEGFVAEGRRREAVFRDGVYCDIEVMSMLRTDINLQIV